MMDFMFYYYVCSWCMRYLVLKTVIKTKRESVSCMSSLYVHQYNNVVFRQGFHILLKGNLNNLNKKKQKNVSG